MISSQVTKLTHKLVKVVRRSFVNVPRRDVTKQSSKLVIPSEPFNSNLSLSFSNKGLHKLSDRKSVDGYGKAVRVSFDDGKSVFEYDALTDKQILENVEKFDQSSTLTSGVDLTTLNQIKTAYDTLKNNPKVLDALVHRISKESHKPLIGVKVEVGELLYGLGDTFDIILDAVNMGVVFEDKYLSVTNEPISKFVVGNHPSNFTVYIHPILEAIALGIPAVLLNHPNLPTAANYLVNYLEKEGVDFTGKIIHGTVGSEEEMQNIYSVANQGVFIGDKPSGERLRKRNVRTYLELSGTNPYIMTNDYFKVDPKKAIEELKFNLTYSDGKQCTAPSVLALVGFTNNDKNLVRQELQRFSDELQQVPATEIDQFGQPKVSYPIAGNPGNIAQFKDKEPFVSGLLPIFKLNNIHEANEVFGLSSGIVEFESLNELVLTHHQLSLGVSLSDQELGSFFNYLNQIGPKKYAGIVNLGDKASNLAACPTGERFFPFNSTQSGWDVGMGAKSPLRFKSAKITDKYYELNKSEIEKNIHFSNSFEQLLNKNGIANNIFKAEAFTILKDLKPTLNSRPQGPSEVKIAFEITLGSDDPLYIRLSLSDTLDISNNYVRYALHSILLGKSVIISYPTGLDLSEFKNTLEYDATHGQFISLVEEDDSKFITSLGKEPVNVLSSSSIINQRIVNEVNSQFNLVPTNFSPWYMADIFGSFKSFKMNVPMDKIRHYGELLYQTFYPNFYDFPEINKLSKTFFENGRADFNHQIEQTINMAKKHDSLVNIGHDVALEAINQWGRSVAKQDKEAVLSLYCDDATLWPTLSNVLRKSSKEISNYFDLFLQKIDGEVKVNEFEYQLIDDNNCICSGIYTFQLIDGPVKARYTYALKKVDHDWKIFHHHSSLMPE